MSAALSLSLNLGAQLKPQEASASPALYTLGGTDQLLPFSAGAWGGRSSVVAMNPAAMSWLRPSERKSVGFLWVNQALSLSYLERPEGVDVPDEVYDARPLSASSGLKPLPSSALPARGLNGGAEQQLALQLSWSAQLIGELSVGVTSLVPLHRFELQSPSFPDERAQYFGNSLGFERWGDSLEGLSTALGLAHPVGEWLSLGVGLNMNTSSRAQSDVFLGDVNYDGVSYVAPRVEVDTALSPFASLEGRLKLEQSELRLHVSAHAPERVEVEGVGEVQVWGFPYPEGERSIPQRFKQVYRSLPLRAQTGLSWRHPAGHGVALGLGWARWSQQLNRAGERVAWSDQWDLKLGAVRQLDQLSVGLDLRWRPSPVPEQIGRTSYVDPDQLASALSLRYELSERLKLQLQAQAHRLLPRRDEKDPRALDPVLDELPDSSLAGDERSLESSVGLQTNNPGYPGYLSEGWVWVTYLGLSLEL